MKKWSDFGQFRGPYWPDPQQLKQYFFATGNRWLQDNQNDGAILMEQAAYGTDHLPVDKGRVKINLLLWGKPELGVLLFYEKFGGGYADVFSSKGDMSRIREWVRSTHGDPLPIGLFIPFAPAFQAVKEFIEIDGELPKSIEWIANKNLPPNTFPEPWNVPPGAERSYPDVT
ncbi:MAG TPA: hypothetical protein VK451_08010 [Methyloceanibacter sp.]|nr:hypothetical protein [Methyloceanibacter sp.]